MDTKLYMPNCMHAMTRRAFLDLRADMCPKCGAGWSSETVVIRKEGYELHVTHKYRRLEKSTTYNVLMICKEGASAVRVTPWNFDPCMLYRRFAADMLEAGFDELRPAVDAYVARALARFTTRGRSTVFDKDTGCHFIMSRNNRPVRSRGKQLRPVAIYPGVMPPAIFYVFNERSDTSAMKGEEILITGGDPHVWNVLRGRVAEWRITKFDKF